MNKVCFVFLALMILVTSIALTGKAGSQGSTVIGFDKKHGLSSTKFQALRKFLESEGFIVKDIEGFSEEADVIVIVNQTSPLSEGEISGLDSYIRSGHSVLIVRSVVGAVFNAIPSKDPVCSIKVIGGCDPFETSANSTFFKYSRSVVAKGSSLENITDNMLKLLTSKKVWVDRDRNWRRSEGDIAAENLVVMVGQVYGRGRVAISSVEFFNDDLLAQLDNKIFVKELFSWLSSPSLAVKRYSEVRSRLASFLAMRNDLEKVGGNSSVLMGVAQILNKSLEGIIEVINKGRSEEALSLLNDIDKKISDYTSFVSRLLVVETKISEFKKDLETNASKYNISLDKFLEELESLNSQKRSIYEKWYVGDISGANQTASDVLNELDRLRSEVSFYITSELEARRKKQEEQQWILTLATAAIIIVIVIVVAALLYRKRKKEEKVEVFIRPPGS